MAELRWRNASSMLYERGLDEAERFFVAIVGKPNNGRLNWTLTTSIQIRLNRPVEDSIAEVREAWKALRHGYPSVASWLDVEAMKKYYKVGDDEEISKWLKETFLVDNSGRSARDLMPDLPTPENRIVMIFLPQSMEIVMRSNHTMIDGYGLQMLMGNLCEILANPKTVTFGDEASRLSPPLRVAAAIQEPDTEHIQSPQKQVMDFATRGQPPVTLSVKEGSEDLPPKGTRTTSLVLSPEETRTFRTAAKSLGLTVTHIFQAALAIATKDLGNSESDKWSGLLGFSLRDRCKSPYDGHNHAAAVYLTGVALVLENLTDLVACAKDVRSIIDPLKADPLYPTTLGPLADVLLPMLQQAPPPPPGFCRPYYSNLGIVNERLSQSYGDGKVEVVDFFNVADHSTPEIVVNTWSFGERLTISSGFNEVYHTEEAIQKFLAHIKKIIFEALKI